jgi:hypothetical protein
VNSADPEGLECVQTDSGSFVDDGTGNGCLAAGVNEDGSMVPQPVNVNSQLGLVGKYLYGQTNSGPGPIYGTGQGSGPWGGWVETPANNCQPPFVCTTKPNLPVVKGPPTPSKPQQNGCFAGRLIHNFAGDDSRAGVTLTVNIAAGIALRKLGTKAAASLLPGPGWVYLGVATLWDLGEIGEAYFYCGNGAPDSGGNPEP